MARTRKTQAGGVPMWLRKFTQRVGNSAPWGLVQKFTKAYPGGEVTTAWPKVTYKYIILSLKDGMQLNDKVSNIKDDIKLLQGYSITNLNSVIDDLAIKLYGDGKLTNNKIKPIFDANIVALFNTGKLAFIVKIPKSITKSDVYIIYREKNITRHELVSAYKGPIRIFLYMPSGMPSNIANLPKRNEHGLLPHELKAIP